MEYGYWKCIESKTKEKVCFIAGSEFMGKEGHLLTIHKAL